MSRSYKKVLKLGNCTGSNTEYYKNRRRKLRRVSRQQLHINEDDFVHPEKLMKYKDSWNEPTDGTFLVDRKDVTEIYSNSRHFRKFINKLKPRNNNHEKNV